MRSMKKLVLLSALLLAASSAGAQEGEKKATLRGGALALPEPVRFEAGADRLGPEAEEALGLVAAFLKEKKSVTLLRVEGHAAAGADGAAAQKLSERRALTVARWLAEHGVACERLTAVGFGSTKPAEDSGPGGGRIEFVVAGLGGRPVGGLPADGGGQVAGGVCRK